MGISDSAWNSWSKLHENPLHAMAYFYASEAGFMAAAIYLLSALPFTRTLHLYVSTIPFIFYILCDVAIVIGFWRHGPEFAHSKMLSALVCLAVMAGTPILYAGYL